MPFCHVAVVVFMENKELSFIIMIIKWARMRPILRVCKYACMRLKLLFQASNIFASNICRVIGEFFSLYE